jgi:hypothetical protein
VPTANDPREAHSAGPVDVAPRDVAEQDEGRGPQAAADDVVGQELAKGHVRRPGHEGRDGADEAEEAADEDRHAAAALEERLDLLEALPR